MQTQPFTKNPVWSSSALKKKQQTKKFSEEIENCTYHLWWVGPATLLPQQDRGGKLDKNAHGSR